MVLRSIVSSAAVAFTLTAAGCAGGRAQPAPAAAAKNQGTAVAATTTTKDAAGEADPDRTYVCSYERPTGSNIPVRVCRSLRQIQSEREKAQQDVGAVRARPTGGH